MLGSAFNEKNYQSVGQAGSKAMTITTCLGICHCRERIEHLSPLTHGELTRQRARDKSTTRELASTEAIHSLRFTPYPALILSKVRGGN
jgi:hypothetical protein